MATELDLTFGGDDTFPPSTTEPVDVPVLQKLDESRHEYQGQQIIRGPGGYRIEGTEGLHKTIFHATSRIDEMRNAAFTPHLKPTGASGQYSVAGVDILRTGPKSWEVADTGEIHRTLKSATSAVAERFRAQFTNPYYSESVQATVKGPSAPIPHETAQPPAEPVLQKVRAGQYQYQGFDISRTGRSWYANQQKFETLQSAVGGVNAMVSQMQPLASIISTAVGNPELSQATVMAQGPGTGSVDTFTAPAARVPRDTGRVSARSRSISTLGVLDPASVPSSVPPVESSAGGLTPPLPPVFGAVTHPDDPEDFRQRKREAIEAILRRNREYAKSYSDQQARITQTHRQAVQGIRDQIQVLGGRSFLGNLSSAIGLPGHLFGGANREQVRQFKEQIREQDVFRDARREELRQQRFTYRTESQARIFDVRGATFENQAPLGIQPVNLPGVIQSLSGIPIPPQMPGYRPPTQQPPIPPNQQGYTPPGQTPPGGPPPVPPPVQPPGGAPPIPPIPPPLPGGTGGGLPGMLAGALLTSGGILAAVHLTTVVFQRLAEAGERFNRILQGSITGLQGDDPVKYFTTTERNIMAFNRSIDPTGGGISALTNTPMGLMLDVLETIETHTDRITKTMQAFAPQTMATTIEDRIRLFENDIYTAQQLDPTIASINAAKTDAILAMRAVKTELTEAFGPILAMILKALTGILRTVEYQINLANTLWEFLAKFDNSFKWLSTIGKWITGTNRNVLAAARIQDQISRFFGTHK